MSTRIRAPLGVPTGVRVSVLSIVAVGVWAALSGAPVQAQTTDLTGEICLDGSAVIQTPAGPFTYCLMQGRLGANQALELDDTDGGPPVAGSPASVADANLFSSADPVNDPDLPPISGATYIDWDDLTIRNVTGPDAAPLGSVENHRILDFTANDDFTVFRPQAASCLNDGSALPKEDFTQSYIANNDSFIYFAQERRTNNGNSVYYWLLTQNPPVVVPSSDCGASTRGQFQFNLTADDVELLVNFPDSGDPASGAVFFRQFTGPDSGYVPARDAVFHAGWGPLQVAPVLHFALNIVGDGDDGIGHWGGIDSHGDPIAQNANTYASTALAEWGVDLEAFFGGGPICGQRLYITGMSRSSTGQSGDPTEPSALKDVVGPKLYSFGEVTATAELTPSCDLTFGYSATAVGIDGVTPIPPEELACTWTCTDSAGRGITMDETACSGTGSIPRGDGSPDGISCTVHVSHLTSFCEDDADASTTVFAPIVVSISPTPDALTCTIPAGPGFDNGDIGPGVTYAATVNGGDGVYSYAWNVLGPNAAVCGNAATCVIDVPDSNFCAQTTLSVGVDDGEPLCPAVDSETEAVLKFTQVNATDN